jgi:hypothetical protein
MVLLVHGRNEKQKTPNLRASKRSQRGAHYKEDHIMAKQQKKVIVLARIEQKNAPQSCYKVRSSEPLEIGEETEYPDHYFNGRRYNVYTVHLVNCKVQSCNCPSHGKCYHAEQCQILEDERYADRRATLFAKYLAIETVKAEIAAISAKHSTTVQPDVSSSKIISISERGTLNKQTVNLFAGLPSRQKEVS